MDIDRGITRKMAAAIVQRLRQAGHEAYFVGGCVRDLVMGRQPTDYDIVTSATPKKVQELFPVTIPVGVSFGVVLVVEDGKSFEVATYRTEKEYTDGRRPSHVSFSSATEDVKRRDFTANGLLMDPETQKVIDYIGGLADIDKRLIRTIGPPGKRFSEDHLRMLRAVRFTASLDFELDKETFDAIRKNAFLIHRISAERIREELAKLLRCPGARRGMELLQSTGLLGEILPEVEILREVDQPPDFHPEGTVWEHVLRMLDGLCGQKNHPEDLRLAWAVIFHDIGKAVTRLEDAKGIHFYGHVEEGGRIAETIMRRLKFSGADMETILAMIQNHMKFMNVRQMRPSTLKRFLRMPDFDLHLALHRLDCLGSHGMLDFYEFCRDALEAMPAEELHPPHLLTGQDLIDMGLTPGPRFKEILRALEDAQLGREISSPEDARRWVLERLDEKAKN